jgi:hypothetical protein
VAQVAAPAARRPNAARGGILGKNDSQYWRCRIFSLIVNYAVTLEGILTRQRFCIQRLDNLLSLLTTNH